MKRFPFFLFLLTVLRLDATTIHWFTAPGGRHVTEDREPMDETYRFELGVFRDGFTPTPENTSEWSAHWVAAQRVIYHPGNHWFTAVHEVEDNEGAFASGTPAYIWGFTGTPEAGEWILFRNSGWRWPRATPGFPIAREWSAADADEILMGEAGGTSPDLMRSGRVQDAVPPVTAWEQWLAENNRAAGPEAVLAYATGSDRPQLALTQGEGGQILLEVPRRADHQANVWLEVSEDLVTWRPKAGEARFLRETPTGLIFSRSDLEEGDADAAPVLFFRFRAALP